jgi:very-short-patch-repair endonuclease
MREQPTTLDQKIAEIASRQHGNVTREQLLAIGMSSSAIGRRLEKGLLIRQHRAVYRVGHQAPSMEATYMAAVLAAGEGALLVGAPAAHLMRLLNGAPPPPEVIAGTNKRRKGAKRGGTLHPRDATKHRGVPVTTVARTLVDLAASLPGEALGRACHQAMVLYRTRPEDVEEPLARKWRAKGAATLRSILRGDTKITLSKLERRFLAVLEENGLELPSTNERVGGRYVDCRWPERRLTVELDGYRYHASRHAWEQDRRRERQARGRGDDFRRYTWNDVSGSARALVRELRPVIGVAGYGPERLCALR